MLDERVGFAAFVQPDGAGGAEGVSPVNFWLIGGVMAVALTSAALPMGSRSFTSGTRSW